MIGILIFFVFKYEELHLLSKSRDLLSYLYTLDAGEYNFKSGSIYNENKIFNNTYYFDGNGKIKIDKYNNVSFLIESNEYCVSKTALGSIKIEKSKCGEFVNIDAKVVKNNNIISFNVNKNDLDYMISKRDDFKGEWIHKNYKDNIILKSYDTSKYYIWFRDVAGNVSDAYSYQVECFLSNKGEYEKDKYYCDGSIVSLNDINYIVVNDNENEITLMKQNPLEEKLYHCTDKVSDYCYYTNSEINKYKWSNSYINYYLNNDYINSFKDYDLVSYDICDDIDNKSCDGEYCGGYTREEIESNKWSCSIYTKSKIRIINYYEFSVLANKYSDMSLFKGSYWMSDISNDKGYSVSNADVYIYEDYNNKLDIRPIITIKK